MSAPFESRGYAHGDVLVSSVWRITSATRGPHHRNPTRTCCSTVRHIPGAVQVDWTLDLNDQSAATTCPPRVRGAGREIGITPGTTLVFYGDKNNWWACYALVFQLFGHTQARVLDADRLKWEAGRRR